MNLKNSFTQKLRSRYKRHLAGLLAILMAVSPMGTSLTAYADTGNASTSHNHESVKEDGTPPVSESLSAGSTIHLHWNGGKPNADWNGGLQTDPQGVTDLTGLQEEPQPVEAPTSVTRPGYLPGILSLNDDWQNPLGTPWPNEFPIWPDRDFYYIYRPDLSKTAHYSFTRTGRSDDIIFEQKENDFSVETPVNEPAKQLQGYNCDTASSSVNPEQTWFHSSVKPVGTVNADGSFSAVMPSEDLTVKCRYEVKPDAAYNLTVNYQTRNLNTVAPSTVVPYAPEDPASAAPADVPGFRCTGYEITSGVSSPGYGSEGWIYPLICRQNEATQTYGYHWNEDDKFHLSGPMPNQAVTITYHYTATDDNKSKITVTAEDIDTNDDALRMLRPETVFGPFKADNTVGRPYPVPYGYTAKVPAGYPPVSGPNDTTVVYDTTAPYYNPYWGSNGVHITLYPVQDRFQGTMPPNPSAIHYKYKRVPNKWTQLNYKPGLHGSLSRTDSSQTPEYTASPDVHDATPGVDQKAVFSTDVLGDDNSLAGRTQSYTMKDITSKRLIPAAKPDDGYLSTGWFIDTNTDGIRENNEPFLKNTDRFPAGTAVDVTASFEEDPNRWLTVSFRAGDNGTMDSGQNTSYHGMKGVTWGQLKAQHLLPEQFTPNLYFVGGDWYLEGSSTPMTDDTPLVPDGAYVYQFVPDPAYFGTNVKTPQAQAGLNSHGEGRVVVYQAAPGYQYVLTGTDGRVLAVNDTSGLIVDRSRFDQLYPGTRYQVYEARGSADIKEGSQISAFHPGVAEPDGNPIVSSPAPVLTPVLDTNYQITFDEQQEGKTVLTIKPADAGSDYALLNEEGHVVKTPQTGNDGWQHLSGGAQELTFSGLGYNKEYTAVARPKNAQGISAESKKEDGTQVLTDPGGAPQIKSYTIETLHGTITQAGDQDVNTSFYTNAHKGDQIQISADPQNAAGEPFLKWEVLIGPDKEWDAKSRSSDPDQTFTMPASNLVLNAVYRQTPSASPANAAVTYEVRGDKPGQLALDPDSAAVLGPDLTTDLDRDLMAAGATITYKVIYQKNNVAASESDAVKQSNDYVNQEMEQHETAYKTIFGLTVSIERYVNGRRVELDSASASSARHAFQTHVQVGKDDKDMLDYQLYEISTNDDGLKADQTPLQYDMADTGGLSSFDAMQGGRYVLICSKAFPVRFMNYKPLNPEDRFEKTILVRKGENLTEPAYSDDYDNLNRHGPKDYFIGKDGAEYYYKGWSYNLNKMQKFQDTRAIVKPTDVYAYYKDNAKEVAIARDELDQLVYDTRILASDYFLKIKEAAIVGDFMNDALAVLDQTEPHKATQKDLEDALSELRKNIKPYQDLLNYRYHRYDNIQDNESKGGSHSGGSGGGTRTSPYNDSLGTDYTVGTNGNWVELPPVNGQKQFSFVLNGGLALSGMWAKLTYPDGPQGADAQKNGWYHFDNHGVMESGWISDQTGSWYYLSTEPGGTYGKMATEWMQDPSSSYWYYLDPVSGVMQTGWKEIAGKQYFFNPTPPDSTGTGRPLGAMYQNETTPDHSQVGPDGAKL